MYFSKFKNFFFPKQNIESTQYSDNTNRLIISVKPDGKITIDLDAPNYTQADAEHFAVMLFLLNEGQCSQTILDLLFDLTVKDKSYVKFMEKIITTWSGKIIEAEGGDTLILTDQMNPIVSPSSFYTNIGQQKK